jgi:hypothetical protein
LDYHLWGRVEQIGEDYYLGIATALLSDGSGAGVRVEQRIKQTRGEAEAAARELVVKLGAQVRAGGDVVVDVETDGV